MRQLEWYKDNKAAFYQRLYIEKINITKIIMMLFLKGSYEMSPVEVIENS